MKLYVLLASQWDDTDVCGVTDDAEIAARWRAASPRQNSVEECELNAEPTTPYFIAWRSKLNNGT